MAGSKCIREAADRLDELVSELATFARVAVELAGADETAPQWPCLVETMVSRVESAAAELGVMVRRGAP